MDSELACIIDLETGGLKNGSAIFSIGAVVVDLNDPEGEVKDFFYEVIDMDSACKHGLLDLDTMLWWSSQSEAAKAAVFNKENPAQVDLYDAMERLKSWYITSEAETVWGNGATFDVSMLEHYFLKFEIPIPWHFTRVRDIRTLVHLVGKDIRDDTEFNGIEHHALHDAAYEAKYTALMWQTAKAGLERIRNDGNDRG